MYVLVYYIPILLFTAINLNIGKHAVYTWHFTSRVLLFQLP